MVAARNVRRRHHLRLKVRGAAVRGRGTVCGGRKDPGPGTRWPWTTGAEPQWERGEAEALWAEGLCAGIVGSSGEGPRSRVTGPQWVERPLEGRGMRSLSVRPLQGSGPGCAGGRPLGGWGWRSGCADEGSWYSVCGVRVPRGWGAWCSGALVPWCPGRGPGGSRESVCLPGGVGVLGGLESAIPVGGGEMPDWKGPRWVPGG